eukprot:3885375-Alexandrium_andersonii.AAC.1
MHTDQGGQLGMGQGRCLVEGGARSEGLGDGGARLLASSAEQEATLRGDGGHPRECGQDPQAQQ